MTAGGDAQSPTPGYTRSHRSSCGPEWRAPGPPAGDTVSQAVRSLGTEHGVSPDCTVLLGMAAEATDKTRHVQGSCLPIGGAGCGDAEKTPKMLFCYQSR